MTQRIEVNVMTGERKVIVLTPEEIADATTRTAQEMAERAARIPDPVQVFLDELRTDPVKLARMRNLAEGR